MTDSERTPRTTAGQSLLDAMRDGKDERDARYFIPRIEAEAAALPEYQKCEKRHAEGTTHWHPFRARKIAAALPERADHDACACESCACPDPAAHALPERAGLDARAVWKAWYDGMVMQGRWVPVDRSSWETLPEQDKALDAYIAARLTASPATEDSTRDR